MDRTVENYQHRALAAGRWRTIRLREVMCDYFVGENEYKTDRAFIERYFYDFAVCARR